jgi:arginyl-tRNA synthetase
LKSDDIPLLPTKDPALGDYSTSIAMSFAKQVNKPPIEFAEEIKTALSMDPEMVSSVTVTPPGFINFFQSESYSQSVLQSIITQGSAYGKNHSEKKKRANVEFVSANPTGPLTVGHGRQAVLGDTISNILEWHGYDVTREYYFNDAGRQMRILSESVQARYFELLDQPFVFPEDGYQGSYIKEIAQLIIDDHGNNLEKNSSEFRVVPEKYIFKDIKSSLKSIGISHDIFSNEKSFYDSGAIKKTVEALRDKNLVYEKDDATWLKTTSFGKDQDRVLIKSSGEPTYRLPDIAYHCNKLDRKFDLLVDIFGSDHMDTYPDVLSAVEALGYDISLIKILIHQFVTLLKNDEIVKMSTRKGDFVTLEELTNSYGSDVVRYFFIMRGMNSHLNFDLDLAQDQSEKNPVFYLQYAHARICNIIKRGNAEEITTKRDADFSLLTIGGEKELIRKLDQYRHIMQSAYETLEPQIVVNYLQELAGCFHKFYAECRVITDDKNLSEARLGLIESVKIILAAGMQILGVSTPERM